MLQVAFLLTGGGKFTGGSAGCGGFVMPQVSLCGTQVLTGHVSCTAGL